VASTHPAGPTRYEDINVLLSELLAGVRAILGDQLVGIYLYGSLSLGDFDPASSDVDFLAVTADALPQEMLERLRQMHADIAASGLPYATRLEGSYIPRAAWRRYDPGNARHPTIGTDGPFQVAEHGRNWIIERTIVREHGVVVWGPSPRGLIDSVSPDELRAAACEQMLGVWRTRIDDEGWLRPKAYQAFSVLTFCRALYALHFGTVASKPQAAAWAETVYPGWKPTIEQALAWRADHEDGDSAETIAFMREALAEVRRQCEECAS
jgi:hypothetical protein